VIDDCTVFFLGILPHTLMPTGKSSSPSSPFPLEQAQESSPPPKKTVELKFLELSLSTMSLTLS
jgi:hypothetical protein